MRIKCDNGEEIVLSKVQGGWTVWPDPKADEQETFTIVEVKVGYSWMKLPEPITFSAGEAVPLRF